MTLHSARKILARTKTRKVLNNGNYQDWILAIVLNLLLLAWTEYVTSGVARERRCPGGSTNLYVTAR